jgi:hypothetical protein
MIDFRKTEMRFLQPLFKKMGILLAVIDAFSMKLNPLETPEGVSPHLFASNVADALVKIFQLPPTARKVLHQCIYCLYQRKGMFQGNTINYPTLFDLREFIFNATHFHAQSRDAIQPRRSARASHCD